MSKVVETLKGAKVKVEQGWCQHATAVDKFGQRVHPTEDTAEKWCAVGAVLTTQCDDGVFCKAVYALQIAVPKAEMSIAKYNDHLLTEQADILGLFDRATEIALAEGL